tara:strand:+ start:109 stop:393 length:285 start_codon:yes stop_codon:yes gene_type:complete
VAEYIKREASHKSLITVTHVTVAKNLARATIYVSVYPDKFEAEALAYLKKKRSDIHARIGKDTKLKIVPVIEFSVDSGEKNRQKIDTILLESDV